MISEKKQDEIQEMIEDGMNVEEMANELKISDRAVRRYIRLVKARNKEPKRMPKVLLFDIETAEMEIRTWGVGYKQRPHSRQILKEWYCLAWSAKWLFDSEFVEFDVVSTEEAIKRDDNRILKSIWNLIDEADVVIAHNALKFDLRKLNARFIINGFIPPSSYQVIDTLRAARKHFGFSAYDLDYLCRILGLNRKLATSYELWGDCVKGNEQALKEMQEYNKQDVLSLEDFYVKIRPWIKSHPNLGVYTQFDEPRCHYCLNEDITRKGYYYTPAGKYKSFRCNNCFGISRSGQSNLSFEDRKSLLRSVAR